MQKPFQGNDRYAPRRCLGGGNLGLVYEGYDRRRKTEVALKALRTFSSSGLYRLKQEFREERAVTKVLPMSDFGIIQITRQRLRPSITTDEAAKHDLANAYPVVVKNMQAKLDALSLGAKRAGAQYTGSNTIELSADEIQNLHQLGCVVE